MPHRMLSSSLWVYITTSNASNTSASRFRSKQEWHHADYCLNVSGSSFRWKSSCYWSSIPRYSISYRVCSNDPDEVPRGNEWLGGISQVSRRQSNTDRPILMNTTNSCSFPSYTPDLRNLIRGWFSARSSTKAMVPTKFPSSRKAANMAIVCTTPMATTPFLTGF